MGEFKGTPGKWRQDEHDELDIVNENGASLGEMAPGDPTISHGEALANAQAVAAIPDLLAALKQCATWLRNGDPTTRGGLIECDRLAAIAESAITRATEER